MRFQILYTYSIRKGVCIMKEPIFKATHIVKQFGPTIALNDVDIEIYPGEIRGFIGENGSGKSTMSAIMTGIHEKTSGSMEYHGKPWEPKSMVEAPSWLNPS